MLEDKGNTPDLIGKLNFQNYEHTFIELIGFNRSLYIMEGRPGGNRQGGHNIKRGQPPSPSSRRKSIHHFQPRGPPPTNPYGMSTPPGPQYANINSPQSQYGNILTPPPYRSGLRPPPRGPPPRGPPPKAPIPEGPPSRVKANGLSGVQAIVSREGVTSKIHEQRKEMHQQRHLQSAPLGSSLGNTEFHL